MECHFTSTSGLEMAILGISGIFISLACFEDKSLHYFLAPLYPLEKLFSVLGIEQGSMRSQRKLATNYTTPLSGTARSEIASSSSFRANDSVIEYKFCRFNVI